MPDSARLSILVVEDDPSQASALAEALGRAGHEVVCAHTGKEGLSKVRAGGHDIVLVDLVLPDLDGLEILRQARETDARTQVIIVTGHGTVETAVEAMRKGAYHYVRKPVNLVELQALIERAGRQQSLERENVELHRQLEDRYGFEGIVGNHPSMRRIFEAIPMVAQTAVTVLITGESGTGKELVARAIHYNSPRRAKPFVALSCAALSESLIESELFGHERGAFTGADARRIGRFEYANGGTLFLDEVGDLPIPTQVKLLRVIETGEFQRVGSNQSLRADFRLIAATNQDLQALIRQGKFREELYFRLHVVMFRLPPLRERREDVPLLIDAFLKEFRRRYRKNVQGASPEVRAILSAHAWPGNVRELRNALEGMIVLARDRILNVGDLPPSLASAVPAPAPEPSGGSVRPIKEVEREMIRKALESCGGRREEAARALGIGERTLYRKLERYGLRDAGRATAPHGQEAPAGGEGAG